MIERYECIIEILGFIDSRQSMEMKSLLDNVMCGRVDEWFPLLCDYSAYIMGCSIKTNSHGCLK